MQAQQIANIFKIHILNFFHLKKLVFQMNTILRLLCPYLYFHTQSFAHCMTVFCTIQLRLQTNKEGLNCNSMSNKQKPVLSITCILPHCSHYSWLSLSIQAWVKGNLFYINHFQKEISEYRVLHFHLSTLNTTSNDLIHNMLTLVR